MVRERDPRTGRFRKVTYFPDAIPRAKPLSRGGVLRSSVASNATEVAELAADLRRRVGSRIIKDQDQRAAFIQQRMRTAVLGAYTKAATGRMARGIFAKATKTGTPDGGVKTAIRVTMFNYREARFITNLGQKVKYPYPIEPYRIYARGVEGTLSLLTPARRARRIGSRGTISILRGAATGRLKVPRKSAFFTAGRMPGRGGAESRIINDINGPMMPGDRPGHFFLYPLWVNHPGFKADVLTDIAVEEGIKFSSETQRGVAAELPSNQSSVAFRGGGIRYQPASYKVNAEGRRIR